MLPILRISSPFLPAPHYNQVGLERKHRRPKRTKPHSSEEIDLKSLEYVNLSQV